MKKLGYLLLCVALQGIASSAQETDSVWQGTFKSGPEQRRAVLQLSNSAPTGFHVEFLHDELKINSSALTSEAVKLTVDGGKGTYQGQFSSDRSSLTGMWTYEGHTVSLDLHRVTKEAAWHLPFQYQYHYRDITIPRPTPEEARIPFSPRLAIDYMEQGASAWTGDWQCVACHTNGSYMVVRPLMADRLGPPQKELRDFFLSTLRQQLAVVPTRLQTDVEPSQVVYIAAGLAIWDAHVLHHLSPETSQALDLMFKLQRPAGDWYIEDDNNPPLESSTYQLATVAARAIANAPGWLAQQRGSPVEAKINRLEQFLREPHKMQGDYDRTDLLWAATELPGLLDQKRMRELTDMILAHQKSDGGWSIRNFATPEDWGKGNRAAKLRAELDFADPPSDGHMTGLAIIVLRKSGISATDPRIQRGVSWLLANQRSSGRWWTRSLNRDGWQFISYSSTAYPLLALSLCNALPSGS